MFDLEEFRKSKGLTQVEFAKILNMAHPSYSRKLKTSSQLEIEHALKIANYFGLSLDYIYKDELNNPTSDEILYKLQKLTAEQRSVVENVIDSYLSN
ncbi:MAG: helix-turn-helix transcriptional regulator [Clostridiales bacterium]|nr:helix-turn-helix transcriptional regulator [Clostridiales bacterium]